MRVLVLAVVLYLALNGFALCASPPAANAQAPAAAQAESSQPEIGAWGVDLTALDASVKPGDDFFRYVNGKWIAGTEIPADKVDVGGMGTLQDKAFEEVKAILEAAAADTKAVPDSDVQKLGDWYASLLDEAAIEAAGFAPIKPELDAIAAVATPGQLAALVARSHAGLGPKPLKVGVDFDRTKPDATIVGIGIAGVSMGAREVYLDPAYAPIRAAQLAHIARLLTVAGFDNVEARAKNVQGLETKFAQITWPAAELRDVKKTFNPMPVAELAKRAPGIDWRQYLADAGVGAPPQVNMSTPSSITAMAQLMADEPLDVWKDYLRYLTVAGTARYLPKAARDETFAFFGKVLQGQQEPTARWKDALLDTGWENRPLADALSKAYIERHVAADARPKAKAMIDNLVAAFDARLANLAWMAPETRAGAREKLAKLTIKPLYPDVWRDISGLEVKRGDPVGNARRGAALLWRQEVAWLQAYPDRRMFFQPVYEVNAYANPVWNEIVFEAAIMRPPFFDPRADLAVNYGAIGAVIGHEISHLFDDKGRATDADGVLRDWWTAEDAKRFTRVASQLSSQVGSYEPIPGKNVNGELTLGESIADVAGLVVAYDAYHRSLDGKTPPVLDGFTGDQRFFLAFAQAWRWKGRDAAVDQLMKTDPHPPAMVRPNTVRNLDAWYAAFNVQPGDKLYLKPEDRIKLW